MLAQVDEHSLTYSESLRGGAQEEQLGLEVHPMHVCPCEVISVMVAIATGTPPW